MTKHVAVVGAGLGGLRTAERLRAAGHDGAITVIGAEPHLPYNRPPLSKELLAHELLPGVPADSASENSGADATDDLAALHRRVEFRRRASIADVTFRLGAAVTATDLSSGTLTLADGGSVRFDALVAATGLRPRILNVPGPSGPGSGRHVLRTVDDCAALRAGLRAALGSSSAPGGPAPRVVVVGGGFVGCEVACTARSFGCDVTVVEPVGPPMLRVLGEPLAKAVQAHHERDGISFIIGRAVTAYTGHDRVTGVVLDDGPDRGNAGTGHAAPGGAGPLPVQGVVLPEGTVLPADLVVEAVGSIPNTEWLAGSGLDLTDGILCDNQLAARGAVGPGDAASSGALVCAVGDVARFPNPLFDDVPRRIEHWSMPSDTARRAAATVYAKLAGEPPDQNPFLPLPSFWSDQGELRMWSFGLPALADHIEVTEGDLGELTRGLLVTYRRGGRLIGSLAMNLPPLRHRELREALQHR